MILHRFYAQLRNRERTWERYLKRRLSRDLRRAIGSRHWKFAWQLEQQPEGLAPTWSNMGSGAKMGYWEAQKTPPPVAITYYMGKQIRASYFFFSGNYGWCYGVTFCAPGPLGEWRRFEDPGQFEALRAGRKIPYRDPLASAELLVGIGRAVGYLMFFAAIGGMFIALM